jgi:hypothetical protein
MIRQRRKLSFRYHVLASPPDSLSDGYETYGPYKIHYGEDGKACIVYGEGRGCIRIQ